MGHALGGMFGGGSRDSPAEQEQQVPAAYSAQQSQMSSSQSQGPVCEADTKAFLSCLERSNNEIGACQVRVFFVQLINSARLDCSPLFLHRSSTTIC